MIKSLPALIILMLLSLSSPAQATVGSLFTYEGVLTDSNSVPITTAQSVTFQILYGSCILYEESQNITPGTSGEFSVMIGAGTRQDSTGNTADRIFAASGTVNCSGASAVTVNGFTTRSLHIRVGSTDLSPDVTLGNNPFAINAMKLADHDSSEFLLKVGIPACTSGTYLFYDGTNLTCASLNYGTSAGTVAAGNDSRFSDARTPTGAAGGDLGGTYPNPSVAKIQGVGVTATAPTTGQVLQFNGTQWAPATPTAAGSITSLTGDVTASGIGAVTATVNSIAGSTAANVHSAELAANAATNANTAGTIVKRDAAGNFAAGTITASLSGNVTGNVTGSASLNVLKTGDTMTGNLTFTSAKGAVFTDSTTNTVTLQAPSTVSSYVLKFPSAQGAANQMLTNDGAGNLSWANLAALTSTAVNAPIINTGTALSPVIGIQQATGTQNGYLSSTDWNTFNSKMSNNLNSGNLWIGNGSNVAVALAPTGDVSVSNTGVFTVTSLRGKNISATLPSGTGQVLRYDGTNWTPNFVSMQDLRSIITGTVALPASCGANQTLTYNSVGDNLACATIAITDDQLTFATTRTANTFLAAPLGAAGPAAFRTISSADLPTTGTTGVFINGGNSFGSAATLGTNDSNSLNVNTNATTRMTVTSAGNVGIGTVSPTNLLTVTGTSPIPLLVSSSGGYSGINLFNTSGSSFVLRTTGTSYSPASSFQIYDSTAGTNPARLTVNSSGNVGIGTEAPTQRLDLGGGNIAMGRERLSTTCNSVLMCSLSCSPGKTAIGGGCLLGSGTNKLVGSYPVTDTTWTCTAGSSDSITVYIICANMQ